jgi:hypothetical protein
MPIIDSGIESCAASLTASLMVFGDENAITAAEGKYRD